MKKEINKQIEKEAFFGTAPVLSKERLYGFFDALLVLSGYCIATWSYTQGSYLATLVGFKQLLIGAFLGAILMLAIYQLPVILSVRYGIDIWVWLKAVFGHKGVTIMTVIIILINYPWYAVCADLFASSMGNLASLFGITLPDNAHVILAISCVVIGTLIAYKGLSAITWTTRVLVLLLLLLGAMVVVVGFTSVPFDAIWNYKPADTGYDNNIIPYIISIEANFAFVITLVGGMAEVPRLTKKENSGYWAGVLGQGLAGSFFVVVGAVMAIAMQYVTGEMIDDPTLMLMTLSVPALALSSLLLVAFANIGTQAVGSYIYGVMLKTSFKKASYRVLILILALYVIILCIWGKIIDYFGSFLTISACVYAPLAALLFTDFFLVRKQRLSLRSAYQLKNHHAYDYTKGFNIVGLLCVIFGFFLSLAIYNPVTGEIHNMYLFYLTPTGCSFLGTGLLYFILSKIPCIRRYLLRDREELTIQDKKPNTTPFDRFKVPPKQNLFAMPFIWLCCFFATRQGKLKITKERMKGLKPPYLVLGTHHAFMDFLVTPLALFPHRANYVSELEGFEAYGEWLYRQAGCLGTRKFVDDLALVKNIKRVINRKGILVLYPEARYANAGTSCQLPDSVGKLAKMLNVPVVVINMHGNYLRSPIWNLAVRKEAKLEATITQVFTTEELKHATVEEINHTLADALSYDEYKWQKATKNAITYPKRAEGLELVLYRCPSCETEFQMATKGADIYCKHCGVRYQMTEYGDLISLSQDNNPHLPFFHIPDWYEWQRNCVIEDIKNGIYNLHMGVRVEALPNAVNFIDLGEGVLIHNKDGFSLTFHDYGQPTKKLKYLQTVTNDAGETTITFPPIATFSVHTEYNYRGKGQCITLSTLDNTYFLFPLEEGFNVTKIQFATEYLHEVAKSSK